MGRMTKTCLTSEAARILGLSADAVRWLARRGVLHAETTSGGVRLFNRYEVERLADIRRRRAQPVLTDALNACTNAEPASASRLKE